MTFVKLIISLLKKLPNRVKFVTIRQKYKRLRNISYTQKVDGAIDLPENFTPEAVAPIIRFMYTGRLDVKTGMFSKIHSTANLLQVFLDT